MLEKWMRKVRRRAKGRRLKDGDGNPLPLPEEIDCAIDILKDPRKWTKGTLFQSGGWDSVGLRDARADKERVYCQVCAMGALILCTPPRLQNPDGSTILGLDFVEDEARVKGVRVSVTDIITANDQAGRLAAIRKLRTLRRQVTRAMEKRDAE